MKRIKQLLFFIIFFLLGFNCVYASDNGIIYGIDMDINIDKSGNAHVTERWDMTVNAGTEVYKAFHSMGNMAISDFTVSDDDNNEYNFFNNWKSFTSFESKKYKCGFLKTSSGIELCWGISEYGKRSYTLHYTINNFVFYTNDAQVIYFRLINGMEMMVNAAYTITVTGPELFADSLEVWGYGVKGNTYVYNGKIEAINDESIRLNGTDDYYVLLAKFNLGTFDIPSTNFNSEFNTFDDVLFVANASTFQYDYNQDNNDKYDDYDYNTIAKKENLTIFDYMKKYNLLLVIIMFVFLDTYIKNIGSTVLSASQKYKYGPSGGRISMKKINYFREIPCDGNIYRAFFLAKAYGLHVKDNDFMGCVFLKLVNTGNIELLKEKEKKLFKTKEVTNLKFVNNQGISDKPENTLYEYLIKASYDKILSKNELSIYAENHYSNIIEWFDDSEEYGRTLYIQDYSNLKPIEKNAPKKYVEYGTTTALKEENDNRMNYGGKQFISHVKGKFLLHDNLKEEAIKLAGLKKYLLEFSRIQTKEAIEVKLWKEYLMFASLFGIADKVAKQFKMLYPEIEVEMNGLYFDGLDVLRVIDIGKTTSSVAMSSYSSARSAASSYGRGGFGGGGFNSGGGGGGSFGGGGSSSGGGIR